MKIISKILLSTASFFILLFFSFNTSFAGDDCTSFFCLWDNPQKIQYCDWSDWTECSLSWWISQVWNKVDWIVNDRTFSQYIQDIIAYLIWFLFFVALVYVLYAWFKILVSSWEEEELKKSKSIIAYVIIWIILIFLAYSIVNFVMKDVLTAWEVVSGP